MKNFVVFTDIGQIIKTGICQDALLDIQAGDNEYVIEGTTTNEYQYVENNTIVDMPPKPVGYYYFNYGTKQWVFDIEEATNSVLEQRNQLLRDGPDRISPVWWSSMTPEQQNEWAMYRQALLDITEQADYPEFIVWPIKPQ